MTSLPIYVDKSEALTGQILTPNPMCERCDLGGESTPHVCMRTAGTPGGVLLVGSQPLVKRAEDGVPWVGKTEQTLVRTVKQQVGPDVPVAVTYAIRCPGGTIPKDAVDKCRPYMRRDRSVGKPTRIICFGNDAARSVIGTTVPTHNLRKAWTQLRDGTLVYMLPEEWKVNKNRIRLAWFREDLKWALAHKPKDVPWGATYQRVETEEQAKACADAMWDVSMVFDVETYGRMHWDDYKVTTLAMGVRGIERLWVWPEDSMVAGDPRKKWLVTAFQRALEVQGHGVKYDFRSALLYLEVHIGAEKLNGCTLIWAKQVKADGAAGLDDAAHMVGMGGHKAVFERKKEDCERALSFLRGQGAKSVIVAWEWGETRISPKTGKQQRKKIVTEKRPPTPLEQRLAITAAWTKSRTRKDPSDYTGKKKIKYTCAELIGAPLTEDWIHAAMLPDADKQQFLYGLVDRTVCERYCASDVLTTMRLADYLEPQITGPFRALWDSHLGRAPWAVGWMEHWGFKVDRDKVVELQHKFQSVMDSTLEKIHVIAPGLNPGSSQQLSELLFGKLKLPVLKKSKKTGLPSTAKSVLDALLDKNPIIQLVLDYREVEKLQGSYAEGLLPHIRPDGFVHASVNITGADTGRMSIQNPAMQTIPSRGQFAKEVKSVFVADGPGRILILFDYKTLEVRIGAMLSGDPVMCKIFKDREDPHKRTAEMISKMMWKNDFATCGIGDGSPLSDAQKEELDVEQDRRRTICKGVNFGAIFGQAAASLAAQWHISEKEAEIAQGIVLDRFKGFAAWKKRVEHSAKRSGETWTWWQGQQARRRPIPDIGSDDKSEIGHGSRQSFNTPIQGTGHEFCLAALIRLVEFIIDSGIDAKLVMQVHDSLTFDVSRAEAHELLLEVRSVMEGFQTDNDIPLEVDAKWGTDWGHLEAIDFDTVTPETFEARKE